MTQHDIDGELTRSNETSADSSRIDPRLISVVDEIGDLIDRGEPVDLEAYQRQCPQYREYLTQLVQTLSDIADLGTADEAIPGGEFKRKRIGEFEIIRQVGRGGMGVVYEATQGSLDRRVALKVLPFASLADQRQLRRFKNEARAAATLHHNHIVPVHSVGSDQGVHHYAMQFIDGPSLAEVIDCLQREDSGGAEPRAASAAETKKSIQAAISTQRTRSSGEYYQQVAKWGEQAAEALSHAHENGVLHRDIKPGNLLVDARGDIWITDFGLARLASDASMTQTGDVVGTLRYMSPEQAKGDRVLVDHRADIYGLGATLYELLALTPVLEGHDRESLLRKVSTFEPVAPSHRDANIPHDLETIVMKAIERNPQDRYESASHLADDLRRFRDHRPILAKRPTLAARCRRLIRRHATLLVTAGACLLLATTAIAVVSIQAGSEVRKALGEVKAKNEALRASEQKARGALNVAAQAIDKFYVQFATDWMEDETELTQMQRDYLRSAADVYDRLEPESHDSEVTISAAIAQYHLGRTLQNGRDADGATRCYQRAEELMASLPARVVDENGRGLGVLGDVKRVHFQIVYFRDRGKSDRARNELSQALQRLEKYVDTHPDDFDSTRAWLNQMRTYDNMFRIGDVKKMRKGLYLAERLLEEEGETRENLLTLAALQLALATAGVDSEKNFSRCIELTRQLINRYPQGKSLRSNLASALELYANYKYRMEDFEGARTLWFQFQETLREVENDFPNTLDFAERGRKTHQAIAETYRAEQERFPDRKGLLLKSEMHLKKSLTVNLEYLAKNPDNAPTYSWIVFSLGDMVSLQNQLNCPEQAEAYLDRLVARIENVPKLGEGYKSGFFDACRTQIIEDGNFTPGQVNKLMTASVNMLGDATAQTRSRIFQYSQDKERAQEAFLNLMAAQRQRIANNPDDWRPKVDVSGKQTKGPFPDLCDFDKALQLISVAHELRPNSPVIWADHGWALYRLGRAEEALSWFERSYLHDQTAELASPAFGLALTFVTIGKTDEALDYWTAGLDRLRKQQVLDRESVTILYEAADALDKVDTANTLLETRWPGPRSW